MFLGSVGTKRLETMSRLGGMKTVNITAGWSAWGTSDILPLRLGRGKVMDVHVLRDERGKRAGLCIQYI